MRTPTAAELLDLWDRNLGQPPVRQALVLLAAAWPEVPVVALAHLSVGRRNACLLALRERLFGSRLPAVSACPRCGEQVELGFDVSEISVGDHLNADGLLAETPAYEASGDDAGERESGVSAQTSPAGGGRGSLALTLDGYRVAFRLPDTLDLLAGVRLTDAEEAQRQLLERCVIAAENGGHHVGTGDLPTRVIEAIAVAMAEADPQAEISLSLTCPTCGHTWQALFDIASFLWSEISAWGYRMLADVHTLAQAYGWREADILGMSSWRRQAYLEMVNR
jgi:hypothetical protein